MKIASRRSGWVLFIAGTVTGSLLSQVGPQSANTAEPNNKKTEQALAAQLAALANKVQTDETTLTNVQTGLTTAQTTAAAALTGANSAQVAATNAQATANNAQVTANTVGTGVNTLKAGGIAFSPKVADSSAAASAANIGMLRFTAGTLQVSDGTNWKTLAYAP